MRRSFVDKYVTISFIITSVIVDDDDNDDNDYVCGHQHDDATDEE
jgi:hypothetical protein